MARFTPKRRAELVAQLGEEKVKELEAQTQTMLDRITARGIEFKSLDEKMIFRFPDERRKFLVSALGEEKVLELEASYKGDEAKMLKMAEDFEIQFKTLNGLNWISDIFGLR